MWCGSLDGDYVVLGRCKVWLDFDHFGSVFWCGFDLVPAGLGFGCWIVFP